MKTIFVVRHAKSSWPLGIADFDRPLNDRGKNDAPEMAKRLSKRNVAIDAFITSPAKRALTTCKIFAEKFKVPENDIIILNELYHAPVSVFVSVVESLNDNLESAAIFSHNPGITDFINTLTNNVQIDNMPTCGIYAVESSSKDWNAFFKNEISFLFFDYPKLH